MNSGDADGDRRLRSDRVPERRVPRGAKVVLIPLLFAWAGGACGEGSDLRVEDDDDRSEEGGSAPNAFAGGTDDTCNPREDQDFDGDGFTINRGDCNDCDARVNPAAVEVPTGDGMSPGDENCDGQVDEAVNACDFDIALDDTNPINAARALGVCQRVAQDGYGLVDATFVRADGTQVFAPAAAVGIQPSFGTGTTPRAGGAMLALSSGFARVPGQPGSCPDVATPFSPCGVTGPGTAPPNFPQDVMGCPRATEINDDIALELTLQAPRNATGYRFDFFFYSAEWPIFICDDFNDQFIALVDPPPEGSVFGNISFDDQNNPVSVNIALFEVCDIGRCSAPNCQGGCGAGPSLLAGTGYEEGGGTGWLTSRAPVEPGATFTIRLAIWDTGDRALDSTVLIDNFEWLGEEGTVVETEPVR